MDCQNSRGLHPNTRMRLSRITISRIALAWVVLLFCAALILPNLDSHTRSLPVVKAIVAIPYTIFFIVTPIALVTYFNRAWRRVSSVPNRTEYVVCLSLESIAGAGVLGFFAYLTVSFAIAHLR